MLVRVFLFLTGFGLTVIGSIYIISYLNLLTVGYNFSNYVHFIIGRIECLYAVIGSLLMFGSIYIPLMGGQEKWILFMIF